MDSRLKFLPRAKDINTEAETQKARQAGGWKSQSKEADRNASQAHRSIGSDLTGSPKRGEAVEAQLPGKTAKEPLERPYPKPTQVVKLSKLR